MYPKLSICVPLSIFIRTIYSTYSVAILGSSDFGHMPELRHKD
jgi:hypothetical protein